MTFQPRYNSLRKSTRCRCVWAEPHGNIVRVEAQITALKTMPVSHYPDIDQPPIHVIVLSGWPKYLEVANSGLATIDVAHVLILSNVLQGGFEQINPLRVCDAKLDLQEGALSGTRAKN